MVPDDEVFQLLKVLFYVANQEHQNLYLVHSWLRQLEYLPHSELRHPVNQTNERYHAHQLQQNGLLCSALESLAESHKAGKGHCTDHALERTLMTIGKDGLFDAEGKEDHEEESGYCDECRLTDGRKYCKGHSEDIEQKVYVDVSEFFVELRSQDESVGSVVERKRKQEGQVDAQCNDARYFCARTAITLRHNYCRSDKRRKH